MWTVLFPIAPLANFDHRPKNLTLLQVPVPKPHPRASAVDEFDAAVFKRSSDFPYRFFSSA
jgi:hypothetical protein